MSVGDPAHPVNMSGDEMPAQFAVGPQGPLQIHQGPRRGELEISAFPSLLQQIKLHRGLWPAPHHPHGGETTAIDRHTVAHLQAARTGAHAHGELNGFWGRLDAFHATGFFDDARKHAGMLPPGLGGWQAWRARSCR